MAAAGLESAQAASGSAQQALDIAKAQYQQTLEAALERGQEDAADGLVLETAAAV